jgi:catechol 2,3-dioxygenase-like lactoylglutathione lyase family enzyme
MVTGLIEVILYVRDMAAQVRFYRDTLGLSIRFPRGLPDYSQEYWVTFETGGCILALHGGSNGNMGHDAPKIVFGVPDLAAARSVLLEKSTRVGEIREAAPGVLVCDGLDPEGNPFSLEQKIPTVS